MSVTVLSRSLIAAGRRSGTRERKEAEERKPSPLLPPLPPPPRAPEGRGGPSALAPSRPERQPFASLREALPARRRGPDGPTLRANPYPEVTDPFCRLPLPTFFHQLEAVHLGDLMRLWVWLCMGYHSYRRKKCICFSRVVWGLSS